MNIVVKILSFLHTDMTMPRSYGPFHLTFFALALLGGVALCRKLKPTEANVRRLLLITSVLSILLEVYKQVVFTFSVENGSVVADFDWYAFPWQFCSTPMYVGLLAALIKNRRLHHILCAYLGSFALFAGAAVMVYPTSVFISIAGINIQTMVCHGLMLTIGIYLLHSGYVPSSRGTLRRAVPVFVVMVGIACMMNEVVYHFDLANGETFNMFYISPHFAPHLPVYSLIQEQLPFLPSLLIYVLGFTAAAGIVVYLFHLLEKLYLHLRRRKKASV